MTPAPMWINGRIVSSGDSTILTNDHGLLIGDGTFDTLAVRDGSPRFLARHLRRLRSGIDRLGIGPTPNDAALREAIGQLIASTGVQDARVRITVTAGPGLSARVRGTTPTTIVTIDELGAAPTSVALGTVEWTRNERSPLAGIKSTSWSENAQILRWVRAHGFDEAVLFDTTGRLSECCAANLFLVVDGAIATPALSTGCLPGIIREVLVESGAAVEADLTGVHLERATEAFITSSTNEVVSVSRIDSRQLSIDGPFTSMARDAVAAASH